MNQTINLCSVVYFAHLITIKYTNLNRLLYPINVQ